MVETSHHRKGQLIDSNFHPQNTIHFHTPTVGLEELSFIPHVIHNHTSSYAMQSLKPIEKS